MGDIYRAYKLLNETFDLKLTDIQVWRMEALMKSRLAREIGLRADLRADKEQLMAEWEVAAVLVPRRKKISERARAAMKKKLDETKGK